MSTDADELTYIKTDAGNREVKSRALKLPQRVRTMLILVDGTSTEAQLRDAAARMSVQEDFIEMLSAQGLIAAVSVRRSGTVLREAAAANEPLTLSEAERCTAARKFMNNSVVDAVGLRAFFFTLKVEKCYSRADLAALLPDYTKAITKGSGAEMAKLLTEEARRKLK